MAIGSLLSDANNLYFLVQYPTEQLSVLYSFFVDFFAKPGISGTAVQILFVMWLLFSLLFTTLLYKIEIFENVGGKRLSVVFSGIVGFVFGFLLIRFAPIDFFYYILLGILFLAVTLVGWLGYSALKKGLADLGSDFLLTFLGLFAIANAWTLQRGSDLIAAEFALTSPWWVPMATFAMYAIGFIAAIFGIGALALTFSGKGVGGVGRGLKEVGIGLKAAGGGYAEAKLAAKEFALIEMEKFALGGIIKDLDKIKEMIRKKSSAGKIRKKLNTNIAERINNWERGLVQIRKFVDTVMRDFAANQQAPEYQLAAKIDAELKNLESRFADVRKLLVKCTNTLNEADVQGLINYITYNIQKPENVVMTWSAELYRLISKP